MHRLTGFSSFSFIRPCIIPKTLFHTPFPFHYTSQASNASFRNRFIRMSPRIPETLASRVVPASRRAFISSPPFFLPVLLLFFFPVTLLFPFWAVWFEWYSKWNLMNFKEFEIWFVSDWGWLFQELQVLIEYSFLKCWSRWLTHISQYLSWISLCTFPNYHRINMKHE